MKYLFKSIVLAVVLALLLPSVVFAGSYIADAVQALQNAPVYVAPGTEGTDNDTAGKLQMMLRSNDNIVLIMLPAEAEDGTDIYTIASSLSEELGNQYIIGLAVGREVIGYAPMLPSGVAADQMRRADSVSNDSVTALITFTQNIHIWQAENPRPTPTPLPQQSQKASRSWLLWLLVPIVITITIVAFVATHRTRDKENTERIHFKAPNQVKGLLALIAKERNQVNDQELKKILGQMCLDIEKYFESESNDEKKDSLFFNQRLTEVNEVLKKYIDIQENPRYYYEPEGELSKGKDSLSDFSKYVLNSIRRGKTADLVEYTVNTKILQAQRFR
ncbi:MAG: hypothetical protein WAX66_04310 [Patescibacteria group bacterium]